MKNLLCIALVLLSGNALAERWLADPARSKLEFHAKQADKELKGNFARYWIDLNLNPDDLAGAYIKTNIKTDSITTAGAKQDSAAAQQELLYATLFPTARFEAKDITVTADGLTYIANGKLILRGVTGDALFTFTFEPDAESGSARLVGWAKVKQLDFGIGQGEWLDTSWVGDPIKIETDLYTRRKTE